MSDLEEESHCHSDWSESAEHGGDQSGMLLDCGADRFRQAKELYDAIQIPGELNTRVRAAIESNQGRRRNRFLCLIGTGAAVLACVCCVMFQTGILSSQKTEFTNPSRNMTAYPETKESVNVLQTGFETETEDESDIKSDKKIETEWGSEVERRTKTEPETGEDCGTEAKNREN
ncbi:MAG: hypothetical protein SOW08_12765 [Lachnospiraceae bacterium]|nr:hypothetical protein [Lachnospiraceae bacterium]